MPSIPGIRRGFRLPWRTSRSLEADIEEEISFHLEMRVAELVSRGELDPAAARREALRQFGDVGDARRYMRSLDHRTEAASRWRGRLLGLWMDIAQTWRRLLRSPGFAAVVVLALALGIGATTAIFSVINATQMRPLPVPDPQELVAFGDPTKASGTEAGPPRTDIFSYPLYLALRDGSRLVPGLLAAGHNSRLDVRVSDPAGGGSARGGPAAADGDPERPRGRLVSGNYFDVLRVGAGLGRVLSPADDAAGSSPVVVISDDYWRRRFDSDPSIIGRVITVNGTAMSIVGVGQPGFGGEIVGTRTDLWIPLAMQPLLMPNQDWLRDRRTSWLLLMGRTGPGVSAAQAGAEITALARRELVEGGEPLSPESASRVFVPAEAAPRGLYAMPRAAGAMLTMLLVLTGLVLVVVSANVANLLLARAAARRTEISVRIALGAGRLRVVRFLLLESLLLGSAAGLLAILVVQGGVSLLARRASVTGNGLPIDLSLDFRVIAFAATLSLFTALALGLLAAFNATRIDLASTLRTHGGGGGSGVSSARLWRLTLSQLLVVGQLAVSLVLLASAGILVRNMTGLSDTDFGFAQNHLLIVAVDANPAGYEGQRGHTMVGQLTERLAAIPGVSAVSYSQNGLFSGIEGGISVEADGRPNPPGVEGTSAFDRVGPGYFEVIGARMLRGRGIEERDDANAPPVAVINQTMARIHFGNEDPIGRQLRADDQRFEIVGVVADVQGTSTHAEPHRRFYSSVAQGDPLGMFVLELRTARDPGSIVSAVRREITAFDGSLRIRSAEPLTRLMENSLGAERTAASLAGVAGGLALALAVLGLYGVMTYAIVRRTRELGIRTALGARPTDLTRMVLRETLTLVLFGAVVGVPAAIGAAAVLRSQFGGGGLIDAPSFGVALTVLAITAALAGYGPARRAAGVEPRVALTSE